MKNRNYIMQAAIAGAFLASASVYAGVNGITITNGTQPKPVLFAQELVTSPVIQLHNPNTALDLSVPTGFSLSPSEVRYVRFELSNGAKFPGTATATGTANCTVGAVNGLSTTAVSFSVTAGSAGCDAANTLRLHTPTIDNIGNTSDVAATYSMYDQPSQAQAGGPAGQIKVTGPTNMISFGPSYEAPGSAGTTVIADVSATGGVPYAKFEGDSTLAKLGGSIAYNLTSPVTHKANGSTIQLGDLMATGTAGTKLVVTGDFTAVAGTSGSTGTVFLSTGSACTTSGAATATVITGSTATWDVGATPTTSKSLLCYQVNGTTAVPVKTYTAALKPVSKTPSTYAVTDINIGTVGKIDHNGTVLETPMFSNAAGYNNRFVFMNLGGAAAYTTQCLVEAGKTATPGAAATGTLAAGQTVILSTNVCTVTGTATASGNTAARGSIRFTIATPPEQVKGVYNSVAPNGSFDAIEMLPVRSSLVKG